MTEKDESYVSKSLVVFHFPPTVGESMRFITPGFPRYYNTALHGHYGKTDKEMQDAENAKLYPWEKTDLAGNLGYFLKTKK